MILPVCGTCRKTFYKLSLPFACKNNNMRKLFIPIAFLLFFASCDEIFKKTINGNGNITTQQRSVNRADKIKSAGSFDIVIVQGSSPSVKVEADDNLMDYIITRNEGDDLVIKARDGYNLKSDEPIKVTVTTNELEELEVAGSGNVKGEGKFTGRDHLKISIAGTGNIDLEVNTPEIESHIAGSGNITLAGETRDSKIEIAGMGDYKASDLKSENVEIHIAGSGNTHVYAENKLEVHIAGSGDVYYKGNANITQDIAGSGKISKEE